MIFNETQVWKLYEDNLKQAKSKLEEIEVFCGNKANFSGLNVWVFEKTVLHCIKQELKEKNISTNIEEQVSLGARIKADLAVGHIAIELKTGGLFGKADVQRYGRYRKSAKAAGYSQYVYLAWCETCSSYKQGLNLVLDESNVFYLEVPGEWERFISTII